MTDRDDSFERWQRVAAALSVELITPFTLVTKDGRELWLVGLFPQFGPPNGMLIDYYPDKQAQADAEASGFGYATEFSEHIHPLINPSDYIAFFIGWGWNCSDPPPPWYIDGV